MKPRIETVEIHCACDEFTIAIAPGRDIDVAIFLKAAIYRGWRLIDNDDRAQVTIFGDGVDILMHGLCKRCASVVGGIRVHGVLGAGNHGP